ncbi:MAG: chain-length determining protein [Bacteroidaceae bacterium]
MKERSVLHQSTKREIRLDILARVLWINRKKYVCPLAVSFVIAVVYAFSLPRYYSVEVMLAPEYASSSSLSNGSLGGLASLTGINLNSFSSEDAIYPLLYPDVIKSTDFLVSLFKVKIKTKDGSFSGTYSDYIQKKQKVAWWHLIIGKTMGLFKSGQNHTKVKNDVNPFELTKQQYELTQGISGTIKCSVDKKTDVITLQTIAQDPLVAATMADTLKSRLQQFVTDYRTRKARNDLHHVEQMYYKAKESYKKKQQEYVAYVDRNQDLVLQRFKSEQDALENDMQLEYNAYNMMAQQKQLATSKVQERTPAFTTIQAATVPLSPAGPKRLKIVFGFLFISFLLTSLYILIRKPIENHTEIIQQDY